MTIPSEDDWKVVASMKLPKLLLELEVKGHASAFRIVGIPTDTKMLWEEEITKTRAIRFILLSQRFEKISNEISLEAFEEGKWVLRLIKNTLNPGLWRYEWHRKERGKDVVVLQPSKLQWDNSPWLAIFHAAQLFTKENSDEEIRTAVRNLCNITDRVQSVDEIKREEEQKVRDYYEGHPV